MSFIETSDLVWNELASIARDEGLVLYDLERTGGGSLRVTIFRDTALRAVPVQRAVNDLPTHSEVESESFNEGSNGSSNESRGVSSEDCTRMCKRLMAFFLAEGERLGLSSEPEIDVSSPGINRELRLPAHFAGAIGERVKIVRAGTAVAGDLQSKTVIIGNLSSATSAALVVADEEAKVPVEIRVDTIKRANVEFLFPVTKR